MWDISTKRRLTLLVATVVASAIISLYRMGPLPHDGYLEAQYGADIDDLVVRKNLAAYLRAQYSHAVEAADVFVTRTDDAPMGYGQGVVMWYSAWPVDQARRDVFAARGRISASGIPLVVDRPHNITRTPDGDERTFDAAGSRLLYGVWVDGKMNAAVDLEFDLKGGRFGTGREGTVAHRLGAEQAFGTEFLPRRTDFVITQPARWVEGELLAHGFRLKVRKRAQREANPLTVEVDTNAWRVHPSNAGRLLHPHSQEDSPQAVLGDVLRRSDIVGVRRILAMEQVGRNLSDWLVQQEHSMFSDPADQLPVAKAHASAKSALDGWPPKDVRLQGGTLMPGEGRWRVPEPLVGIHDPPVRATFLRVDSDRSFQRTHLFAFDMSRLGLQFAAGTEHPRSTTGLRGTGRVDDAYRDQVLAVFNGGLKAELGRFGVIEERRTLVPPTPGLATVAVDPEGHARFGLWDAPTLESPWTGMRQNLAPLIVDGFVAPIRTHRWGQAVASLDETRVERSAIGVTASGYLVYGWSRATTAALLGESLRRTGVEFAIHLSLEDPQGGIEFYRDGLDGGRFAAGTPTMQFERAAWQGTVNSDFFYLFRSGRLPSAMPARADDWANDEGVYRVVQWSAGIDVMAESYLTGARVGGRDQVTLRLVDVARLRPHFVLGFAESRLGSGPAMFSSLPKAPILSWLNVGLRAPFSRHGLIVGGRLLRAPVHGRATLAVNQDNEVFVGKYGPNPVPSDGQWRLLVQGPALLEDGVLAPGAKGRSGLPLVAVGRVGDRFLVLATEPRGDRAVLARALLLAGAKEALLLGDRGTSETGRTRLYFQRGAKTLMTSDEREALEPSRTNIGAGSALVFTAGSARSFAEFVPTFKPILELKPPRN